MQTTVWQPETACYRASLPLDLPPEATFVCRNNNNMAPSVPNPNVCTLGGMDWTMDSQDVIVVGDAATKRYVLAGALTAKRSMSYFTLIRKGRFVGISVIQPFIKPGENRRSCWSWKVRTGATCCFSMPTRPQQKWGSDQSKLPGI